MKHHLQYITLAKERSFAPSILHRDPKSCIQHSEATRPRCIIQGWNPRGIDAKPRTKDIFLIWSMRDLDREEYKIGRHGKGEMGYHVTYALVYFNN